MVVLTRVSCHDRLEEKVAKFEIFTGSNDQYYWRLKSSNNVDTIAICGEGYTSKAGAEDGIAAVKKEAPSAPIEDLTKA